MGENNENYLAVEKLIQTVISALVDLLLSQGVTARRLGELVQVAFVKEMERRGQNKQEIAHRCDLSRKTVNDFLDRSLSHERFNGLDSLLENWRKDPEFPMQLPLDKGKYPCWSDLCDEYKSELTSRYILDYLCEAKCVTVKDGIVYYQTSEIQLQELDADAVSYIGFAVENLLNTFTHNMLSGQPKFHERNVWCSAVDPEKEKLLMNYMTETLNQVRQDFHQFLEDNEIEVKPKPTNSSEVGMILSIWKRQGKY